MPQTPKGENPNDVTGNPVKLEPKPPSPERASVNPSDQRTPVEVKPLAEANNESSPSNHGGTNTQESLA